MFNDDSLGGFSPITNWDKYVPYGSAKTSVADPDPNPDPSDPYCSGPSGSGSDPLVGGMDSDRLRIRILLSPSKSSKK